MLANSELTKENWDKAVVGKWVFIKFMAPWCGHCKQMKPDWDKLMVEFKGSKTALVARVDCTASGQTLCSDVGVPHYPTIKYGNPSTLKDYDGPRDFDRLKKFAEESSGPACGPATLDSCEPAKKAQLEKFLQMSHSDLENSIQERTEAIEKMEADFEERYSNDHQFRHLEKRYWAAHAEKETNIAAIKDSGLILMKAVREHKKVSRSDEL